jgi:D-alanyl-D-alanine carboxypeptidase
MSMPKHRRYIPLVCIVLALATHAPLAQERNAQAVPFGGGKTDKFDRALDAHLSKESADHQFSGVVLVAKQGVPVFRKAYGFADRANKRPNTVRTRFNLGSLNKSFTRAAIDQLVLQGRLARTDTLGSVLPDYPQAVSHPATVEQLLNMTAGLNDLFGPEFHATPKDRFRSNADFYSFVSTLPPAFPPGTRFQHCNGCYIALGAMIERITQMPYEQYVTEHIFKPAGMTSTGSLQTDAIERNIAIGYTTVGSDALRSNVYLHGASGSAAGGGYSTVDDLLAFVNASRDGRLPFLPPGAQLIGGNAGVSTAIQTDPTWTVIVVANLDPPIAADTATMILAGLTKSQ